MNQNKLIFIQVQTLPLNMRHHWKENIDIIYKQPMEKLFLGGGPTTNKKKIPLIEPK
jgi:hypothetical protein